MSVPAKTIAAIHVAKKQCAMDDDTYRDFLHREAGVRSARDLDERGARRVLAAFDGLKPKDAPRSNVRQDRRPIAKKALALWLSLYNLDEVRSRHDSALDAFAARVTGKDALRFCTNGEAGRVVEALKDWCKRVGVDLDDPASPGWAADRLIVVQSNRLRNAGAFEPFASAVDRRRHLNAALRQALANDLGAQVRRLKLGSRHKSPSPSNGEEA